QGHILDRFGPVFCTLCQLLLLLGAPRLSRSAHSVAVLPRTSLDSRTQWLVEPRPPCPGACRLPSDRISRFPAPAACNRHRSDGNSRVFRRFQLLPALLHQSTSGCAQVRGGGQPLSSRPPLSR